jgi:hypothetical protein
MPWKAFSEQLPQLPTWPPFGECTTQLQINNHYLPFVEKQNKKVNKKF